VDYISSIFLDSYYLTLPKFSTQKAKLLAGSIDFVGVNYYTAYYVANASKLMNLIIINMHMPMN